MAKRNRFLLEIFLENSAFEDPAQEVARILEEKAEQLRNSGRLKSSRILDVNGNTVGSAGFERSDFAGDCRDDDNRF